MPESDARSVLWSSLRRLRLPAERLNKSDGGRGGGGGGLLVLEGQDALHQSLLLPLVGRLGARRVTCGSPLDAQRLSDRHVPHGPRLLPHAVHHGAVRLHANAATATLPVSTARSRENEKDRETRRQCQRETDGKRQTERVISQ